MSLLVVVAAARVSLDDEDSPASNPDVKSAISKSSNWVSSKGLDDADDDNDDDVGDVSMEAD